MGEADPARLRAEYDRRLVDPETAVATIRSGSRVRFPLGHNSQALGDQLAARLGELENVTIGHTGVGAAFPWLGPGFEDSFDVVHEHWASPLAWAATNERRADYLPMPFSLRFKAERDGRPRDEQRPYEIVCIQCSPPDERGRVNLGPFVWDAPSFVERADVVLAEVVPYMPHLPGEGSVPLSAITHIIEGEARPTQGFDVAPDDLTRAFAHYVAELVPDGACLQIGAGTATFTMAAALVDELADRVDLGWHSEATPPGILPLIDGGVMTSRRVESHPRVAVSAGWAVAGERMAWLDHNPAVAGWEIMRVVDPRVVAAIDDYCAINTAIMVDLTGQATAETVGTTFYGGTGGLLELTIGALWSRGGRSILVLPSTDRGGLRSRIVPVLPEGSQGTVPRTLVDTIVTEFGIARLWGKTVRQRAAELIAVAHPDHRGGSRPQLNASFGRDHEPGPPARGPPGRRIRAEGKAVHGPVATQSGCRRRRRRVHGSDGRLRWRRRRCSARRSRTRRGGRRPLDQDPGGGPRAPLGFARHALG